MAQFRIIQSLWLFIVTLSLSFGTLASYAAAPAALYFSFTQITGKDKSRVSDPHSRAVCRHDRRGEKIKIWSSSETLSDLQVGMLSHKALSVSDLKGRSEREKSRDETNRVRLFSQ